MKYITKTTLLILILNFVNCNLINKEDDDSALNDILVLILLDRVNTSSASTLTGEALEFQKLVNNHRTTNTSCNSLAEYGPLNQNALNHSKDMMNRNFFSHTNPDGKSPFDRMSDDGIKYESAGENIAMGQKTASDVLTAWLNSSGHKANIENCNFTHHGIGFVEGSSTYWTHVFAKNPSPK